MAKRSRICFNDTPEWILATPKDLVTRRCPQSGNGATIDLIFLTTDLGLPHSIFTGPFWSSDHIPIFVTLMGSHSKSISPRIWCLRKSKWDAWNKEVYHILTTSDFDLITDPSRSYEMAKSTLLLASKKIFTPRSDSSAPKEKNRPWWNADCSKLVAESRRAYGKWKVLPTSINKKALNRAEALKKRTMTTARKQSWDKLIEDLNKSKNDKRIWSFTKPAWK